MAALWTLHTKVHVYNGIYRHDRSVVCMFEIYGHKIKYPVLGFCKE